MIVFSFQVRRMIDDHTSRRTTFGVSNGNSDGQLSLGQFESLCAELKSQDVSSTFKQAVSKKENLEHLGGMSDASSEGLCEITS